MPIPTESGYYAGTSTVTMSLTEPAAVAWLVRMSSYVPSTATVALAVSIGGGASQTLTPSNVAQASYYGDIEDWADAVQLGVVGSSPWGTPTGWTDTSAWWLGPDATASSGDTPGEWCLRKWVYFPSTDTYTFSLAADDEATVYVDGVQAITAVGFSATVTAQVSVTGGVHLVTVDALNYGTSNNPTGVLLSIAGSTGIVAEDGLDNQWQTTGFVGQAWSYSAGAAPLFTDMWYIVPTPSSETVTATVTITGTGATVNDLWWYSVAPWRWDSTGEYDLTSPGALPIQVTVTRSNGGMVTNWTRSILASYLTGTPVDIGSGATTQPSLPAYIALGTGTGTASENDQAMFAETYGTRKIYTYRDLLQAYYAQTQTSYSSTDPNGTYTEIGVWDQGTTSVTLGANVSAGATSLTISGSSPSMYVNQQIYISDGANSEYATLNGNYATGATTWALKSGLTYAHNAGVTITAFSGNLLGHTVLSGSGAQITTGQVLSVQDQIYVTAV